jgi:putative membrane protein
MLEIIINIGILIIALLHSYIVWMEMFAWESAGKRAFKGSLKSDLFPPTKVLAANQGLYNGFLVAGLVWSLLIYDSTWRDNVSIFFLCCVLIAGIFGGFTASKKIFWIQGLPALIVLLLILLK